MEATGIAEPKDISALKETAFLKERYGDSVCMTVVDSVNFLKLNSILPALSAQVRAADLLVLNKTDLADEATIAATEREIRGLNNHADVVKTKKCGFDYDLRALLAAKRETAGFAEASETALASAPPSDLDKCELRLDFSPNRVAFYDFLDKFRGRILRGKGIVHFESSTVFVEIVNGTVSSRPAGREAETLSGGFQVAMSFVLRGVSSIEFKNAASKLSA
jgi:G3E family GTPase